MLALLVISAALVVPAVTSGESQSKLRDAAHELETMWARARLDAMATGAPLVFRCELGGERGTVASPMAPLVAIAPDAPIEEAAPGAQEIQFTDVTFRSLVVAEPAGSLAVGAASREGDTSVAVVFHPDGATSDAEAVLENADGHRLKVTLRGLTGATRIEEVSAADNVGATGLGQ